MFYTSIRHPQYLSLGVAGMGLAILWPRFLVVVLWLLMVLVYYFLAKDEEGRMQRQFPDFYREYMQKTGMFLPKRIEDMLAPLSVLGKVGMFAVLVAFVLGGAFLLRDYTVKTLPLWKGSNIVTLAVFPDDELVMDRRMPEILQLEEVKTHVKQNEPYLVYFLATNYVMQGLIADTGSTWHLFERHRTIARFIDWIIHPFSHLGGVHHSVFEPEAQSGHHDGNTVRRLIFVKLSNVALNQPSDAFSINAARTPDFMIDIDVHEMKIIGSKVLPVETAWRKVPTPSF